MSHGSAPTAIDDRLTLSEQTFVTWDGTELFYRAWLPSGPIERALFLLHRGHEHSGRFADLVPQLGLSVAGDSAGWATADEVLAKGWSGAVMGAQPD